MTERDALLAVLAAAEEVLSFDWDRVAGCAPLRKLKSSSLRARRALAPREGPLLDTLAVSDRSLGQAALVILAKLDAASDRAFPWEERLTIYEAYIDEGRGLLKKTEGKKGVTT